jgi:hypothetical protein
MAEAERIALLGDRYPRRTVAATDELEDLALAALLQMTLELVVGLEVI